MSFLLFFLKGVGVLLILNQNPGGSEHIYSNVELCRREGHAEDMHCRMLRLFRGITMGVWLVWVTPVMHLRG